MSDMMTFPDTVEEFMDQYRIVDTEEVYTNRSELVPIFRVKQWLQHERKKQTGSLIDRFDAIQRLQQKYIDSDGGRDKMAVRTNGGITISIQVLQDMIPVVPWPKLSVWKKISVAGVYECSACGITVLTNDIDNYKYCHGCGCEMRGVRDDQS